MTRKILNSVIVLSVALCLPCSILTVFAGGKVVSGAFSEPEDVDILVHAPEAASKGEQFTVTVQVKNRADQPQSLNGVDVSLDYLAGIKFLEVTPPPSYTELNSYAGMQSYYFEQEIPPGEVVTVQFTAVAGQTGTYAGNFDVCFSSTISCFSVTTQTVVR